MKTQRWTDEELKEIEKHLQEEYGNAQKELTKKWEDYMSKSSQKISSLESKYKEAQKSGDKNAIKAAKEELDKAKYNQTLANARYQEMVDYTTRMLADVNKNALEYIQGRCPQIYAVNYNEVGDTAKDAGLNFTLVNEDTVKNLLREGEIVLPQMEKWFDTPKDERWNRKQINSSVLQGILQGESMDTIAKRIQPIVGNNETSAMRTARTLVTGVENKGKLDSYKRLEEEGAIQKKVWLATGDGHTRDWHLDMDGQEVDLNESFIDGLGNELDYPGDPGGAPETVYNCRCAMVTHIVGFRKANGRIVDVDFEHENGLHEEEIEREREIRAGKEETPDYVVVNGTDISSTWVRRPDQFDFEIEDIINAQGFDGLPRVVSREEFEEAVKAANGGEGFIAQRSYSAPDQETLDMYRDQLYNGKWYVDCSTGGAQYGQGMYCAADYTGNLSEGIKNEMEHYKSIGENRYSYPMKMIAESQGLTLEEYMEKYNVGPRSYIETLTLDPSAKVVSLSELNDIRMGNLSLDYRTEQINKMIASSGFTEDQATFVRYNLIGGGISWKQADEAAKVLGNDGISAMMGEVERIGTEATRIYNVELERRIAQANEYQHKYTDLGSLAASLGYDAINAEGRGQSGSYTVILNRTKCIFLEDDQ